MNAIILVPSYQPDKKLIDYIKELDAVTFIRHFVIVDDGSAFTSKGVFEELKKIKKCRVLTHTVNKGKGCALKTGMKYIYENFENYDLVITCDSDGQHTKEDVIKIAGTMGDNKSLVLGVRDFSLGDIPARSSFGNKLTSKIFKFLYKQDITDTQTGLRGIPASLVPFMLKIKGDRFEYETNMLIACFKNNIGIIQTPIKTIYIQNNESSHFNPVVDSAKIYYAIFKEQVTYVLSAFLSFVLDISCYTAFIRLTPMAHSKYGIYLASLAARFISCIFNFSLNKKYVFGHSGNRFKAAAKYFLTVLLVILVSSNMVKLLSVVLAVPQRNTNIIKLAVDGLLFCLTFIIEKKWVFKGE